MELAAATENKRRDEQQRQRQRQQQENPTAGSNLRLCYSEGCRLEQDARCGRGACARWRVFPALVLRAGIVR
jgi:hypothetical protein